MSGLSSRLQRRKDRGGVACIISETFGRFWAEATDVAEGLSMATFVI
jgi:hypothetical protein